MDRDCLRRSSARARAEIAAPERRRAADKIAKLFFEQPKFAAAHSVAGYAPIKGEIDPMPLMAKLHQNGARCALPAIRADKLIFLSFAPNDSLIRGAYGILEPSADKTEIKPELIFVPMLAFDDQGTRLGYGGGYYDRALAAHSAIRIGLAFAAQQISAIKPKPHDIPMHAILTEKNWHLL